MAKRDDLGWIETSRLGPSEIADDHGLRSDVVEALIASGPAPRSGSDRGIPKLIVQFWDGLENVPVDVQGCLDSWKSLEREGFDRRIFGDDEAARFIREHYSECHLQAFSRCTHPAMRSDYFRLCFVLKYGGCYADADDEYQGGGMEELFQNDTLKLQPLCWDGISNGMLDPYEHVGEGVGPRVFYVNNNPLISPPNHPVIAAALDRATTALLNADPDDRDVQGMTGPGNLSACLVEHAVRRVRSGDPIDFLLLRDWDAFAVSKWPLSYRSDSRNWRNWVAHRG